MCGRLPRCTPYAQTGPTAGEHSRKRLGPLGAEPWGFARDRPGPIIWPWVGEYYESDRVALLTLNFRSSDIEATVALEYLAAWHTRESLKRGRKRDPHSDSVFGYTSLATAAVVLASLRKEPLVAEPEPRLLTATMERIVRLQLVKCTPVESVVDRASPSKRMCRNCPPRFLWDELALLRPQVLVVMGRDAYREMNGRSEVSWRCGTYICRGELKYGSERAILLWVPHPTASDWSAGQRALIRSLRRKPLVDEG